MANISPNNIQNLSEDWGHDENTGLPFGGQAVQTFIKSFLRNVTAAAWFDSTQYIMYFFASEEDRESFINDQSQTSLPVFSCPMNFSSTLYRVNVTNYNEVTNINTATNAGTLTLSTSFVVQSKSITDVNWSDLQTGCFVTILIDRGLTGNFEALTERTLYAPGSLISLDVFEYLISGTNRVKFLYEAEDGTVTAALTYNITLSELYVELFNNFWYQPILAADPTSQRLGGFKIAGAGSKTLHFSFYDESGNRVIDDIPVYIGTTNAYVSTPYFYPIPNGSPILSLPTGVYTVKVWVSTSALASEVIEYNVMFVAAADTYTAKLVCINEVADKIFNYSSAVIGKYAAYNAGANYGDITIEFQHRRGDNVVSTSTQTLTNMEMNTAHPVSYEAIWPGIEGNEYSIGFEVELGNASAYAIVPLDNSTVFPPTPEYDFYMLGANRSNGEQAETRGKIINLVDESLLDAEWTGVDFINNVDGWTTDDNGRSCLRIPAGTKVVIPHTAFDFLPGDNSTFEICYKVANVADYEESVITLSPNPGEAGFKGIRIKPTNITVHSSVDTNSDNDSKKGTNLCDEEAVHFALTINRFYEGNNKLVRAYVNGCKSFLFEYTSPTEWNGFDCDLIIGSQKSDVFIYFIRHYPSALSDAAIQTNYINSLTTVAERNEMDVKFASVLDAQAANIDYEAVKNNGFNFFVIQMTQGNGVPSAANGWGKKTEGKSILEMHFGAHPEWDWKIENPETMGQGTTSMNYYRWNIRWRIDKSNADDSAHKKKVPVSYVTERTKVGNSFQYTWSEPEWATTVRFDGPNHPPVMRITAKINQASSMQSHKIGATRAYTELHDYIGLQNEAQAASGEGNPHPVVAVYEYPAFGFEYDPGTNSYTFIGLFTIGPDKGDKPTFGYDKVKSSLITLEGTDHNQPTAKFAYPWIESSPIGAKGDVAYYYNQEGIGINLGSGSYLTGLEISNCHGKEIDKEKGAADQDAVRGILATEFKPAYLLAWENSTLIFPITSSHPYYDTDVEHTLANINAHLSGETYAQNFRLGQYDARLGYADMQFWIEGDSSYTLYYYDEAFGLYKPDISLSQQLGTPSGATPTEKNEWFKEQRRARFKAGAAAYWDLDETLYHFVFCLLIGATDNFAKNSYPYKMATIANDGRWRWRQDDLDTIFDVDNSGRDTKPYQIEYTDAVGGTAYYAGSNSVFWNLINECYWEDYDNGAGRGIRNIGRLVLNAMMRLSGANNPYDGFVKYISQCFWGNAQDYFPASAYNVDAVFKYELAWINNGQEVPPLEQALGNHYSGERLWVRRRAIYMLSLFRYGPFGDYSDRNLGRISFRPLSLTVTLTPILWMYPALAVGQNNVVTGGRTEPGANCVLSESSDGNTVFYIQASNFLTSLGSLKGLTLGQLDLGNIIITAAKLVTLSVGSATPEEVTTNIPGFEFSAGTNCLEEIDARNAASLTEMKGLAYCIRLRRLLLSGTNVTAIELATGCKLEELSLPASFQRIVLRGLKHLHSFSMDGYASVNTIFIEETSIDVLALLQNSYDGSSALQFIRIVWADVLDSYAEGFAGMIEDLSSSGRYFGLATDGSTVLPKPYIDGTIFAHSLYSDDLDAFHFVSEETYQTNLKKGLSRVFDTNLFIIYDPAGTWIRFVDSNVESICLKWDTGGDGKLSIREAAAVTAINYDFAANTEIEYFEELKFFTGLRTIGVNVTSRAVFSGCTNLKRVDIPEGVTKIKGTSGSGNYANSIPFYQCSALERIALPTTLSALGDDASHPRCFNGCSSLVRVDIKDFNKYLNITFYSEMSHPFYAAASGSRGLYLNGELLEDIVIPAGRTTIKAYMFYNNNTIKTLTLPPSLTSDAASVFSGCTNLQRINISDLTAFLSIAWTSHPFVGRSAGGTLWLNGEQVTSLIVPDNITALKSAALYRTNGLTSVTLHNAVTSIGSSAFYGCGSLVDITIPSSVTSIGGSAFGYCSALEDFEIPASVASVDMNVFTYAGSRTAGALTINGNFARNATGGGLNIQFKKIVVKGNITNAGNQICIQSSRYIEEFRVMGSINTNGQALLYGGSGQTACAMKFFEVLGKITSGRLFYDSNYTLASANAIVHLGYDTVDNGELPCTPAAAGANLGRMTKVYVGIGDEEKDQEILQMYLADSSWASYSSKLATWASYNGPYKD